MAAAICLLANATLFAQDPTVIVGGIKDNHAAIWVNGMAQEDTESEQVYYVAVDGMSLYAAGRTMNKVPVIWQDGGEVYNLGEGDYEDRSISSMTIHNGDVYTTTIDLTHQWINVSNLWINGVPSNDYADAAELYAVYFDGDDMYVAGRTETEGVIWKNGEPLYTCTSDGIALFVDVVVVDGDVYYLGGDFGGGEGKNAALKSIDEVPAHQAHNRDFGIKVWKNGEELYFLSDELYGGRMAAKDGNIYVAGQAPSGMIYRAYLWTNGEPTPLADEWSGTGTLCLYKEDIYVTGFMGSFPNLNAYIWKNGELTSLTSESYNMGNCILVVDNPTSVEEAQESANVYPNPANGYVMIEGVEFEEAALYNSLGQLVLTTKENKIDVSGMTSGLYLLKLDGKASRNIVIQH